MHDVTGFAVEMHGTSAARAAIADELGARQSEMLAKCAQQRHARLDFQRRSAAVDIEFDCCSFRSKLLDDTWWQRLFVGGCSRNTHQSCRGCNCTSAP